MPSGVLNRAPPDAASGWWSYDAKERRINELERENAGLKAKVGSLEAMNTALQAKQVALGAEVSALRSQGESQQRQHTQTLNALTQLTAAVQARARALRVF